MEGDRGASDRDRTTIGIFLRRESQRERERERTSKITGR